MKIMIAAVLLLAAVASSAAAKDPEITHKVRDPKLSRAFVDKLRDLPRQFSLLSSVAL